MIIPSVMWIYDLIKKKKAQDSMQTFYLHIKNLFLQK